MCFHKLNRLIISIVIVIEIFFLMPLCRYIQLKDYERIREEIDQLAGSWPPLIRSASVQELPRELFQDAETVRQAVLPSTGQRGRKASVMSNETEDEGSSQDHVVQAVMIHAPSSITQPQRSKSPDCVHSYGPRENFILSSSSSVRW